MHPCVKSTHLVTKSPCHEKFLSRKVLSRKVPVTKSLVTKSPCHEKFLSRKVLSRKVPVTKSLVTKSPCHEKSCHEKSLSRKVVSRTVRHEMSCSEKSCHEMSVFRSNNSIIVVLASYFPLIPSSPISKQILCKMRFHGRRGVDP